MLFENFIARQPILKFCIFIFQSFQTVLSVMENAQECRIFRSSIYVAVLKEGDLLIELQPCDNNTRVSHLCILTKRHPNMSRISKYDQNRLGMRCSMNLCATLYDHHKCRKSMFQSFIISSILQRNVFPSAMTATKQHRQIWAFSSASWGPPGSSTPSLASFWSSSFRFFSSCNFFCSFSRDFSRSLDQMEKHTESLEEHGLTDKFQIDTWVFQNAPLWFLQFFLLLFQGRHLKNQEKTTRKPTRFQLCRTASCCNLSALCSTSLPQVFVG